MKRFGQIEIIVVVIIIVASFALPAGAGITWSGDVDPSDPSTWDSSTSGYIGKTGSGTMGITGDSDVINYYGYIGYESGSTGAVTVDGVGSTWTNNANLYIGDSGNGTLNITNGGAVSNRWTGYIGLESGGTGEVTVDGAGSTWTINDQLSVGHSGNGMLNITGGGAVSSGYDNIGSYFDSTGEVTVDGANSTWTNSEELFVGMFGNGTLNITGGGAVNSGYGIIGVNSSSTGAVTVDGAGSTWSISSRLYVGNAGNGTLNITDGGLVSVAQTLTIDTNGGDDSFINMATGGMLALFGEADESLAEFMGLIEGYGAIRYWNESIAGWADITGATLGVDYTLEYLSEGELAGYTMLTVPEPGTMGLFCIGGLIFRKRRA